jgi:predicted ATPase
MYVSRFRLRNWKNFQTVDASLGERAFVIGPNASGKSNFLDAFRFLRDVSRDGLRKAVDETRGGVSAIRCLAARRHSQIEVFVELRDGGSTGPATWEYELAINQDNNKRAQIVSEVIRKSGREVLRRPDDTRRWVFGVHVAALEPGICVRELSEFGPLRPTVEPNVRRHRGVSSFVVQAFCRSIVRPLPMQSN